MKFRPNTVPTLFSANKTVCHHVSCENER